MELVAVLLSFAAFLVSYVSLHLSNLRRADLELEYVPDPYRAIAGAGFTGGMPNGGVGVGVRAYVIKTGARAGILERVGIGGFDDDDPYWSAFAFRGVENEAGGRLALPLPMQAGDILVLVVRGELAIRSLVTAVRSFERCPISAQTPDKRLTEPCARDRRRRPFSLLLSHFPPR